MPNNAVHDHPTIIEIDWAEDQDGMSIIGPIGPFPDIHSAQQYGERLIYNGEWNVAILISPTNHYEKMRARAEENK